MIDVEWSMSIWSEREKRNIFEGTYTAIFGKPCWNLGPVIDYDFTADPTLIITLQFKKWAVKLL